MRVESFTRAKPKILEFFQKASYYAFTSVDLRNIFEKKRDSWKIAQYRTYHDFIKVLEKNNTLHLHNLEGITGQEKKIWVKSGGTNYDIGLTIKKGGYLSNYTAMQEHGLTLQIPKTIYVSVDKYQDIYSPSKVVLEQENVDEAFAKPQRTTSVVFQSKNDSFRYSFLQKKYSSINVGVVTKNRYRITDIERTLIDIAVRPAYSGGIFEVLGAFENARDKVDVIKIYDYLNKLNYIYPYHQLIGFYMYKAEYSDQQLQLFYNKISPINFYLTYNLTSKKLDPTWKIYYPMGF